MSRAKLQVAKELILQDRFEEARNILEDLDDPTATRWLRIMDGDLPPSALNRRQRPPNKSDDVRNMFPWVLIGLLAVLLVISTLWYLTGTDNYAQAQIAAMNSYYGTQDEFLSDPAVADFYDSYMRMFTNIMYGSVALTCAVMMVLVFVFRRHLMRYWHSLTLND